MGLAAPLGRSLDGGLRWRSSRPSLGRLDRALQLVADRLDRVQPLLWIDDTDSFMP